MAAAERLADGDAAVLEDLTAEELASIFELGFGLIADYRGKHWEIASPQAERLGKWVKKVIEKHGLAWVMKWVPEIMLVLLFGYEITKRVRIDHELAQKKKQLPAPAAPAKEPEEASRP